jgi:Domain of unknown function (DUF4382)
MKITRLLPFAALATLALASCSKSEDAANTSKLEVRLMDAPGDFQRVVLDVRQIEVHLKDDGDPDGWKALNFSPQAINVLDYVNGRSARQLCGRPRWPAVRPENAQRPDLGCEAKAK